MPLSFPFGRALCVVNNRDQPVSVMPYVEYHISSDAIGIAEYAAYFRITMPADRFNDARPRSDLIRSIREALHRLAQMTAGNDMHFGNNTSRIVKLSTHRVAP